MRKLMNYLKSKKGYSLAEALIAVAIVGILASIGIASVAQLKLRLRQKELDGKAQTIYMAAQSKMETLKAGGYEDKYNDYQRDPEDPIVHGIKIRPLPYASNTDLYSFDSNLLHTESEETKVNLAANAVLPEGSIDDEIWGNYWVVEYDAKSGSVSGVFYTEEDPFVDYMTDEGFEYYDGLREYDDRLSDKAKVGYYGGESAGIINRDTITPLFNVTNGEELKVTIFCGVQANVTFDVTVKEEGGNVLLNYDGSPITASGVKPNVQYENGHSYVEIVLDSLVDGQHFKDKFGGAGKLTPGKNIIISAKATTDDGKITSKTVEYGVKEDEKINSLFGSVYTNDEGKEVAVITCGRHLQNLDKNTSGVMDSITVAEQKSDIFFECTDYYKNAEDTTKWGFVYPGLKFIPIENENLESYTGQTIDGKGNRQITTIYGVDIENKNGNAGLFGTFYGKEISNVIISNESVTGSSQTGYVAGGLVGKIAADTEIRDCSVAFMKPEEYAEKTVSTCKRIEGNMAGGLVGSIESGKTVSVENSFAAGVVGDSATTKVAGGLVGKNGGILSIKNSYADCYIRADNAGGLVGGNLTADSSKNTIENCYASGYITAKNNAAGLVLGNAESIKNAYAASRFSRSSSADRCTVYSTAVSIKNIGANSVIYLNAGNGINTNIADTIHVSFNDLAPGTSDVKSIKVKGTANNIIDLLGTEFTLDNAGHSNPYNLLKQGLGDYDFPRLRKLDHYGDWDAQLNDTVAYYEAYKTGTNYKYGFKAPGSKNNGNLIEDMKIVGDGYGWIFAAEEEAGAATETTKVTVKYLDKNKEEQSVEVSATVSYNDANGNGKIDKENEISVTGGYVATGKGIDSDTGIMKDVYYVIIPFPKGVVNTDYAAAEFYQELNVTVTVGDGDATSNVFYYNPHFAGMITTTAPGSEKLVTDTNIEIRTARQLYNMSLYYNDYEASTADAIFSQTKDIDYQTYEWTNFYKSSTNVTSQNPIGYTQAGEAKEHYFEAVYDGNNHVITGVSFIAGKNCNTNTIGMFGQIGTEKNGKDPTDAKVINTVIASYVDGANRYVSTKGSLNSANPVYIGTLAGKNYGTIYNCAVAGYAMNGENAVKANSGYKVIVGGLVGFNAGKISYCSSDVNDISISANGAAVYAGGFVGENKSSKDNTINNSYALGTINVISSDIGSNVRICGFAGINSGSITYDYCAVALNKGRFAEAFAFSSSSVSNTCYYLYGGTYSYLDELYRFNNSKGGAKPASYQEMIYENELLTEENCRYHIEDEETIYPFKTDVTTGLDNRIPVHYGNWVMRPKLGTMGVFYWEHEAAGTADSSNDQVGYHLSFIGTEEEGSEIKGRRASSLCNDHDDGNTVTEYGYGYYEIKGKKDSNEKVTFATSGADGTGSAFVNSSDLTVQVDAKLDLEKQFDGYVFYPYTTENQYDEKVSNENKYLCLAKNYSGQYGLFKLTYKGNTRNYQISPFFADAMAYDGGSYISNKNTDKIKPFVSSISGNVGNEANEYEVRNTKQLQYINWNYGTASVTTEVTYDKDIYSKYTYLQYDNNVKDGYVTKNNVSNNIDRYWDQTHDIDASNTEGFVPIAGALTYSDKPVDYGEGIIARIFELLEEAYNDLQKNILGNGYLYTWFGGHFNGESYKISNLKIESGCLNVGLFGVTVDADINNVNLYGNNSDRAQIIRTTQNGNENNEGSYSIGGLIGTAYEYDNGTTQNNTISNCSVAGYKIVDKSTNKQTYGGGIIGGLIGNSNVNLERCSAVTDIVISSKPKERNTTFGDYIRVGGLVGSNKYKIKDCYSGGSIEIDDSVLKDQTVTPITLFNISKGFYRKNIVNINRSNNIYVGGISGSAFSVDYQNFATSSKDSSPSFENCYTYITLPRYTGAIRAESIIGSIAERFNKDNHVNIKNCYFLDSVVDNVSIPTDEYFYDYYTLGVVPLINIRDVLSTLDIFNIGTKSTFASAYNPGGNTLIGRLIRNRDSSINGGNAEPITGSYVSGNKITNFDAMLYGDLGYIRENIRNDLLVQEIANSAFGNNTNYTVDLHKKSYKELSSEEMVNLLNDGTSDEWSFVTRREYTKTDKNGNVITDEDGNPVIYREEGKYSYNTGIDELLYKDFPFPTSLKQLDPMNKEEVVNVHYGRWDVSGFKWEKGAYRKSLFEEDNIISTKLYVPSNEIEARQIYFVYDEDYFDVAFSDGTIKYDSGKDNYYYDVNIRVLKNTPAKDISAYYRDGTELKNAKTKVSVTEEMFVYISPTDISIYDDETGTVLLNAYSDQDVDITKDLDIQLTCEDSNVKFVITDTDIGKTITVSGKPTNGTKIVNVKVNYTNAAGELKEESVLSFNVEIKKRGIIGLSNGDSHNVVKIDKLNTATSYNGQDYVFSSENEPAFNPTYNMHLFANITNETPELDDCTIESIDIAAQFETGTDTYHYVYPLHTDTDFHVAFDMNELQQTTALDGSVYMYANGVVAYVGDGDAPKHIDVTVKLKDKDGNLYVLTEGLDNLVKQEKIIVKLYASYEGADPEYVEQVFVPNIPERLNADGLIYREGKSITGWASDIADDSVLSVEAPIAFSEKGDYKFYARWTDDIYIISFTDYRGKYSGPESVTLVYGQTVRLDENPYVLTDTNFEFDGWYEGETKREGSYCPKRSGNTELVAKWIPKTYTISFDPNYEGASSILPIIRHYADIGEEVEPLTLTNLSREGYTFDGWYHVTNTDLPGTYIGKGGDSVTLPEGDITLTAKWTGVPCVITLIYNDTYTATDIVPYGTEYTLPKLEQAGSTGFWYVEGDIEHPINAYTVKGDITFIANWTPITYYITYTDINNDPIKTEEKLYGEKLNPPTMTDIPGHAFEGWKIGETPIDIDTYTVHENAIVNSAWINVYDVVLMDGESQYGETLHGKEGQALNLPKLSDTDVKAFLGWYAENATDPYDEYDNFFRESITLYAKWANIYTVTLDADGGEIIDSEGAAVASEYKCKEGDTFTLPLAQKTKTDFDGWKSNDYGVDPNALYKEDITIPSHDTHFTAQYTNLYTVTFNYNYNTPNTTKTGRADGDITLPEAERDGYFFMGWYSLPEGGDLIGSANSTYSIANNLFDRTLYAHWELKKTVIYHANGGLFTDGKSEKTVDLSSGTSLLTEPEKPSREGHDFADWFNDPVNGVKWNFATDIVSLSNTDLYAHWTPISYTYQFVSRGETFATFTDVWGANIRLPETTPTNYSGEDGNNYTFNGWFTSPTDGIKVTTSTKVDGNKTYYAQFKVDGLAQYTYVFVDGDTTYATVTDYVNKKIKLPNNPPVDYVGTEGLYYEFTGWYTDPNNGTQITAESLVTGDATYYAHWKKYAVVTFNANGGTMEVSTTTNVPLGETLKKLPEATRYGYELDGWYYGNSKFNTSDPVNESIILIAKWIANTHTITLDTNGGTLVNATSPITTAFDSATDLPDADDIEKDGYSFDGWYTSNTDAGVKVSDPYTLAVDSDITLYARWTAKKYKINLDTQGGKLVTGTSPIEVAFQSSTDLPDAEKTGYDFDGWFTSTNIGGKPVSDPYTVTEAKDITLYAHWSAKKYTITLDPKGGEIESGSSTIRLEYLSTTNLPKATRTGYDFSGWFETETDTGSPVESRYTLAVADNITLYAHWNAHTHNVTFDANGGTIDGQEKVTREVKFDSFTDLPTPVRGNEFVFDGWYTSDTDAGEQVIGSYKLETDADVTLYAHWKEKIKVTFTVTDISYTGTVPAAVIGGTDELVIERIPGITWDADHEFMYWYDEKDNTKQYKAGEKATFTESTVLCARWDTQFIVTFNSNGGSNVGSRPVDRNKAIGELPVPTRNGYTFNGWYIDAERIDADYLVHSNITVNAHWLKNVTITFDANGGKVNDQDKKVLNVKETDIITEYNNYTLERDGYEFVGWVYALDTSTSLKSSYTVGTNNVTFLAVWNGQSTVTFDANGGFIGTADTTTKQVKVFNGKQLMPADVPTPEYDAKHLFLGWYTDPTGGTELQNYQVIGSDVTYYAHWKELYKVTLDLQGGNINGDTDNIILYVEPNTALGNKLKSPGKQNNNFEEWNTNADGTGTTYNGGKAITTDNLVLYAVWDGTLKGSKIVYQVEDDAWVERTSNPIGTAIGQHTIEKWPDAGREGYTLKDWRYKSGSYSSDGEIVKDTRGNNAKAGSTVRVDVNVLQGARITVIVYAEWEPNSYTIKFMSDVSSQYTTVTGKYTESVSFPQNPTKAGYTFAGWWTMPVGGERVDNLTPVYTMPLNGTTLYAHWEKQAVVTFVPVLSDYVVKSGSLSELYIDKNTSIGTLPVLEKNGYSFDGWWTAQEGGTKIDSGYAVLDDITLYAHWSLKEYTLTFDAQGGDFGSGFISSLKVKYTSQAELIRKGTKTGYIFAGWATTPKGTDIGEKFTMPAADTTLYALWTPIEYNIEFISNNVEGSSTKVTGSTASRNNVKYNDKLTLTNGFSKVGYTFNGWNTQADGNGTSYSATEEVSGLSTTQGATVTLYAQWKANEYTVEFRINKSGFTGTKEQKMIYDVPANLEANTFAIEGYDFSRWNTKSDKSGDFYNDKVNVLNLTDVPNGKVTLFAVWTPHKYNIVFDKNDSGLIGNANGETAGIANAEYGKDVKLTSNGFTLTGYNFDGWKDSNGNTYTDGETVNDLTSVDGATVTLYAQWQIKSHTISYVDENSNVISSESKNYGSSLSAPTLTKDYYTFDRFIDEIPSTMPDRDVTIKTTWVANKVTIYYHTNAGQYEEYATVSKPSESFTYNPDIASYSTTATATVSGSGRSKTYSGWYAETSFDNRIDSNYIKNVLKTCGTDGRIEAYAKWPSDLCVIEGTMITMADGSQKPVEELCIGDTVLSLNHFTGEIEVVPILINVHSDLSEAVYKVMHLNFDDGNSIGISGGHMFFDKTLMKYVLISIDNYEKFLGHEFVIISEDCISTSVLEDVVIKEEKTRIFSPVSYKNLNLITNNILSEAIAPNGEDICNYSEYNNELKFDEHILFDNISKFGLYTYEDWEEYLTREEFDAFNVKYVKLLVGRGVLTENTIINIINISRENGYVDKLSNEYSDDISVNRFPYSVNNVNSLEEFMNDKSYLRKENIK